MQDTFYLLAILNHESRKFNLRIETDPEGKHSLESTLAYIHNRLENAEHQQEIGFHKFWWQVATEPTPCVQLTLAEFVATDPSDARTKAKPTKEAVKLLLANLGYTAY